MRIKNTSRYPEAEVRALVEFGMRGVNTARLQVNVKNCRAGYRGMAYKGVPSCSPASRKVTVDRLVTLGVGPESTFPEDNLVTKWGRSEEWPLGEPIPEGAKATCYLRGGQPHRMVIRRSLGKQPYGGKSSPHYTVNNWREALVAVAAHEARHIYQMQHGKRLSEVDAEKFAAKRLEEFRAQEGGAS